MGIQPSTADYISAGGWQLKFTYARCHGTGDQNGGTNEAAEVRVQVRRLKFARVDTPRSGIQIFHLCTQAFDQVTHHTHIPDLRYVSQSYRFVCKKTGSQQRKCCVLVSCSCHFSVYWNTAFYNKFFHTFLQGNIAEIVSHIVCFDKHITVDLHAVTG